MRITRSSSGLYTFQNAAAAPNLIRGQKTFTGAANLGATGACPIFNTTGAVFLEHFFVRCTVDLVDAVDGAAFTIGVTGTPAAYADFSAVDLDTIIAGGGLGQDGTDGAHASADLAFNTLYGAVFDNILMTISTQAITGGALQFFALYRPLTADGRLSLGTGMVAI